MRPGGRHDGPEGSRLRGPGAWSRWQAASPPRVGDGRCLQGVLLAEWLSCALHDPLHSVPLGQARRGLGLAHVRRAASWLEQVPVLSVSVGRGETSLPANSSPATWGGFQSRPHGPWQPPHVPFSTGACRLAWGKSGFPEEMSPGVSAGAAGCGSVQGQ